MKEELEAKLFQEGRESFPAWWIVLENIGLIVNWGIGFILLLPFKYNGVSVISWLYLIVLVIVQILLKKHNCSTCYYYGKWCHLGWGKLTCLLFKQDSGNPETGIKLAISYILQLPVILIAALAAGFLYDFNFISVVLLIIFMILNLLQGVVLRKKGCALCKARYICKGSAASNKELGEFKGGKGNG